MRNRTERRTVKGVAAVYLLFLAVAAIIVAFLAKYQIKMHETYQDLVLRQITVELNATPERGIITDRNGNILASNKTVYNVVLSPADVVERMKTDKAANRDDDGENDVLYDFTDPSFGIQYRGTELDELIVEVLSGYLTLEEDFVEERLGREEYLYSLLKKNVEEEISDKIKAFIAQYDLKDQIYFEASSKRYYPQGDLAAHVIGFTNSEGVGIYGLEAYYNNVLEGTSGRYITAQDARRQDMPFEYERYVEAESGYNIVTTLDIYIQYELENQLEKTFIESGAGNRVTGIVMDVDTGEVLAMATYPAFDLNDPYTIDQFSQAELDLMGLDPTSEEYKTAYNTLMYRMWNNKAITETYEPGSTFKIVTTAMAMEEAEVTPTDNFFCSGSLVVEGWPRPIKCHKHEGHGAVTFRVGLQQSCNPVLMTIAQRVGRERFYDYFDAFGYMEKTGIDLPGEVRGIYTPYAEFGTVSLAVYSFGQTFKTTPLQQLRAISSVANGGYLITPHLLKNIADDSGNVIQSYETEQVRQVVSTATCQTITEILEEGVATNGGAKNAYVKGYRVAAKTGTSEKRDEYDENGETPFRVGSCAAFAPADDPRISAIIIVDKPLKGAVYGSTVAAPYISSLLGSVLPYIGVEPQYTTEELAALDVTLSNYVGAPVENCHTDLEWRSFSYEIIGNGDRVTAQIPPAGSKISSDTGILLLYTDGETPPANVKIPDLVGMSAYNANNAAVSAGLNVTFYGSTNGSTATAIAQSPAAGTFVPRGTIVEIELRHLDGTD